jgi:predicted nucleotidyltransferase
MRNWGKIVDKRSCSKTNRVLEQAHLLKKGGCKSIYLFGSLAAGKNHEDSDIDIGIKGLPKGKFFEICSKVYFAVDNNIDIVDFDSNEDLYSLLNRLGEVVEIG